MRQVELLCLANSYRPGGRCIAGLTSGGQWIRPVSAGSGAIGKNRCRHVGLLDVIRVSLAEHRPEPHQPENWLLADSHIDKVHTMTASEAEGVLISATVPGPSLLGTRDRLVQHSDCVRTPVKASLAIVVPEQVEWLVDVRPTSAYKQIRCSFSLVGQSYTLPVTDPWWISKFKHVPIGQTKAGTFGVGKLDRLLFTVSLGGPVGGNCYKLVAAVIVLNGVL